MLEQIHEVVLRKTRNEELRKVMHDGLNGDGKSYKMNPLLEYIAKQVEQAYIAGASGFNFHDQNKTEIVQDLIISNLAESYTKGKGFRI